METAFCIKLKNSDVKLMRTVDRAMKEYEVLQLLSENPSWIIFGASKKYSDTLTLKTSEIEYINHYITTGV
jgi:hypothetical protein